MRSNAARTTAARDDDHPPIKDLGSKRDVGDGAGVDFARFDLVGEHSKRQGARQLCCTIRGVAVGKYARKLRDLSNPATVRLLLQFNG